MRRRLASCILSLVLAPVAWARSGDPTVADIVKQMTGCFRVTFHYIEDGEHDALYEPVLERAELTSTEPIVINRYLIVGGQTQRHWSDHWQETADGQWRQEVTGPFDDLRYVCEGEWTLNQFRCVSEHAPKPRRDAARPYDYLERGNALQINSRRWVHAQTNRKLRHDGSLYSVESGWNVYERVDDALCAPPPSRRRH